MDISAIALQGVEQAQVQMQTAVSNLAGAAPADGANLDTVTLSAEMVALMSAKTQFAASVATLKTADQVQQSAINLMA
jgi:flagellar basal body rod protein FlgC